jgi:hypothetical protein
MGYKPSSLDRNGDVATYMYNNVDLNEFPKRLEKFFHSEGYKLESGTNEKGVYGTGSHMMRILFGAFVKRYTFQFKLAGENGTVRLEFASNMTGVSGGVIGYNKMKKELERLINKIQETEL